VGGGLVRTSGEVRPEAAANGREVFHALYNQPSHISGGEMERIYDTLQRIQSLWKELERTKPDTSEYVALMNQIRALSHEYSALIDAPKKPVESKTRIVLT